MNAPVWLNVLLIVAAALGALAVIWKKAIKPGAQVISKADEALPVMAEFVEVFKGKTNIFLVLREIADEFKTDSGTTLRDVVNRLEAQSKTNAEFNKETRDIADQLAIALETARQLSERDRQDVQRMLLVLDRLSTKADDAAAQAKRASDG